MTAPALVDTSLDIEASPETVWSILTSPERFGVWMDGQAHGRSPPKWILQDHRVKRDETDGPAENRAKPANAVRNEGRTSEMEAPHCPHGSPPTSIAREAAA
jgi:uncharacterized protein YndB with AHSA1/START domain